jgi:uncharacterized protein YjiK
MKIAFYKVDNALNLERHSFDCESNGEKILELRNPLPLYAITTPDKKDIITSINLAQYKLSSLDPGWKVALSGRYYAEVNGRMMALSPESQAFLQELRASDKVFRVVMMPNANPLTPSFKTGVLKKSAM